MNCETLLDGLASCLVESTQRGTERYLIGRAHYSTSEIVDKLDDELPMFILDEFPTYKKGSCGLSLSCENKQTSECFDWVYLCPLRNVKVKSNEICVAVVFNDGIEYKVYKRWKLETQT
jgi:hypothetical protein